MKGAHPWSKHHTFSHKSDDSIEKRERRRIRETSEVTVKEPKDEDPKEKRHRVWGNPALS